MSKFEREIIKNQDLIDEKQILIGLVTNKEFLLTVRNKITKDFFDADYMKIIASWCLDFFDKTKEAIKESIQDVYEKESYSLEENDSELIEEVLSSLSEMYSSQGKHSYLEIIFNNLYKKKELKKIIDEANFFYRAGEIDSAYKTLRKKDSIEKNTTTVFDPFSKEEITKFFVNDDNDRMVIFDDPTLNKFFRYFKPGWFVSLQAVEKGGKCSLGTEHVLLSNGDYLPIKEIIETKRTDCVSYDEETQSFVPSKIIDYWENGVKPVYELKTRSGRSVRTTKEHQYLTPDGWKPLSDLSIGEYIATPRHIPFFGSLDEEEYKVRLTAYFIADGGLTTGTPGFTKTEPEVQDDFTRCVELMGCRVKWKGVQAQVTNADQNRCIPGYNYVKTFLEENNLMGKLAYDKSAPPFVFNLTKEKLKLFLGILFTCDGWICDKEVGYCSTNKVLAEQVQHFLLRFGIVSKLRFKKNDFAGGWVVCVSDYHNMKLFVDEIGFHFSKKEKAIEVIKNKPVSHKSFLDKTPPKIAHEFVTELKKESREKGWGFYEKFGERRIAAIRTQIKKNLPLMKQSFLTMVDSDSYKKYIDLPILWDEVESIEYKSDELTYDLTIEKTHNFISEDILVHNSFLLEEFAFSAVESGYNVLIMSIELNEELMKERIYCRLTGRSKDEEQDVLVPLMDCKLNQHNQCTSRYRQGKGSCYDGVGQKLKPEYTRDYVPCTYCRDKEDLKHLFIPGIWHKTVDIPKMTSSDVIREGKAFKKIYKGKMKVCCPDPFSAKIEDIENTLDYLEEVENFYPHFLILDYLDIVDMDTTATGREKINQLWIRTKQLTDRKRICTITVEQASKLGSMQVSQDATHVSEEKRKNGHVNAKYSINMTKEEEGNGVVRVGCIFHRHFRKTNKELLCLRQLEVASPIIDCELTEVVENETKRFTYK